MRELQRYTHESSILIPLVPAFNTSEEQGGSFISRPCLSLLIMRFHRRALGAPGIRDGHLLDILPLLHDVHRLLLLVHYLVHDGPIQRVVVPAGVAVQPVVVNGFLYEEHVVTEGAKVHNNNINEDWEVGSKGRVQEPEREDREAKCSGGCLPAQQEGIEAGTQSAVYEEE